MPREHRLSERAQALRAYYTKHFLPKVNNPHQPRRFHIHKRPESPGSTLEPDQDAEFRAIDVATAIMQVVEGEEERNLELYRRGASTLIQMDRKYHPYRPLNLRQVRTSEPSTGLSKWVLSRDGKTPMEELVFDLAFGVPIDEIPDPEEPWNEGPSWSNSTLLYSVFLHYLSEHRRYIQLGVCHWRWCKRLYIKTKGKPYQRYCSKKCSDRERYERKREKRASLPES
ncbi:hypothetical protein ACFLSF_03300 [Candidatus Bipolaricaulota bacterium]